jgi:hypothetical protein
MNTFRKTPLLLSLIFFIFSCSAFIFLYKVINDKNQKIESDTIKWQEEASRREDIRKLNSSLEEITDNGAQLENHFAESSDIVPFLDTVEKLASEVGAKAEINSVNAGADNTQLVVELKASGSFGEIYKFLTLLENSSYELDFLSMDMNSLAALDVPSKNAKDANWEAVFKIQLLSFIK